MGVRSRSSAGGAQFGLSVSTSVVTLTVPNAANVAEIYVRTASVVFTRDGTDPTATAGTRADPGSVIFLNSREECETFEVIRQGGTDATLDVEYFTDLPSGSLLAGATPVQGLAASDAAEVGNPVPIGGSVDDTSPAGAGEGDVRRLRATPEGNVIAEIYKDNVSLAEDPDDDALATTSDALRTIGLAYGMGTTAWQRLKVLSNADAAGALITGNDSNLLKVLAPPYLYNGATGDVQCNNVQTNNYIAASLVSATQNGADRTNYNAKGLLVMVDVTARNGTSTITIAVQTKDGNGNYGALATAAAALSAVGQARYLLYPTAGVTGVTEHFQTVLASRTYRVIATYGGSDTISFDVDVVELMA